MQPFQKLEANCAFTDKIFPLWSFIDIFEWSSFYSFTVFSSITFTINMKNNSSGISCRDSNPRPLEHESPPINTSDGYRWHHPDTVWELGNALTLELKLKLDFKFQPRTNSTSAVSGKLLEVRKFTIRKVLAGRNISIPLLQHTALWVDLVVLWSAWSPTTLATRDRTLPR